MVEVGGLELGVAQADEVGERRLVAGVRCGGGEHQVPLGIGGQGLEQFVALMPGALPDAGAGHAVVRLVDDDQLRAAQQELVAAPVGLDEVGGDDDVRVTVEQRLVQHEVAFEAADGAGQHQRGVDAELVAQLALPLLGQRRGAQHGQALHGALREQLGGDQAGLDGLADADVVGDEQPDGVLPQRHEQRHVLVAARADADARPGSGTGRRWR